jgi:hypothetical protein
LTAFLFCCIVRMVCLELKAKVPSKCGRKRSGKEGGDSWRT